MQGEWNGVQRQVESYDRKIATATASLEKSKKEAGEIEMQLAQTGKYSAEMAEAMERSQKSALRFKKRLHEVLRSALVFTLITQSLAKLRNWIGDVIRSNNDASASVARLKGALLTAVQPLVDVVIPAFKALVEILTAIAGRVAEFTSAIFGTTVGESAKAAKGLNDETKAIEGVGGAAKKATKQLASFDEINKLSAGASGGAGGATATDFEWQTGVSDLMKQIADDVLLIGAGLALWKISDRLPGTLGAIVGKLGGIIMALGGLLLLWHSAKDAIENGLNWKNLIGLIAGAAAVVGGLALAFGSVGAGIGLIVSSAALLITAFKDMDKNGVNLKNTLLVISGILAAGVGISLLIGSWIPLAIAGIASVIVAITNLMGNGNQLIQNFKDILGGFVDFLKGVFTGDLDLALSGIKRTVTGTLNAVLTIVGSLVNAIIKGLNWLIGKINSIHFEVPEWVPLIGGKGWSPSIPPVKEWDIPQLAQGAVIPPNRQFLAMLGDQKSGTNIEAPLETIVRAMQIALGGRGQNEAVMVLDDEVVGKLTYKLYNRENKRVGTSLKGGAL